MLTKCPLFLFSIFILISCHKDLRYQWNGSEPVSCAGLFCVAVGAYNITTNNLYRLPFSTFSIDGGQTFVMGTQPALPIDTDITKGAQIESVSCIGTRCVAVGGYNLILDISSMTASGSPIVLISNDSGNTFTRAYMPPLPQGANPMALNFLDAITCNGSHCVGVRGYNFMPFAATVSP